MKSTSVPFIGLAFGILFTAACGAAGDGEDLVSGSSEITAKRSFVAQGTGYYPDSSTLEGGFVDRKGAKLRTLQDFLDGKAEYVSVAMDTTAFPYGQRLRIRELDAKHKKAIIFRVVDTGGAFKGKGTSRIDICTANKKASLDPTVNGTLHVEVMDEKNGPPDTGTGKDQTSIPNDPFVDAEETDEAPTPNDPFANPTPTIPSGSGALCASDGACNPGNDGSGLICKGGRCIPGCRSNAHCPGVTTCHFDSKIGDSGQCR